MVISKKDRQENSFQTFSSREYPWLMDFNHSYLISLDLLAKIPMRNSSLVLLALRSTPCSFLIEFTLRKRVYNTTTDKVEELSLMKRDYNTNTKRVEEFSLRNKIQILKRIKP